MGFLITYNNTAEEVKFTTYHGLPPDISMLAVWILYTVSEHSSLGAWSMNANTINSVNKISFFTPANTTIKPLDYWTAYITGLTEELSSTAETNAQGQTVNTITFQKTPKLNKAL